MTFDLVVATVGRTTELERFLASLDAQTYRGFRVLVVDQNTDDRVAPLLGERTVHLRSPLGLSRARNVALTQLTGDAVAFPDDDCIYPDDLLERVAARLAGLDGVTGREPWWTADAAPLTRDNLWNRAISFTIFLRKQVVERVGLFDERLGLPSSSGEEIDYLIRALDAGMRVEYDPSLVVEHPRKQVDLRAVGARDGASIGYILRAVGARDGASIGYILRKHGYGRRAVARMLVRPAGGVVLDPKHARFHLATLRGRIAGYRG